MSQVQKDALPDGMTEQDLDELLNSIKGKRYRSYDLILVNGEPLYPIFPMIRI